MEKTFSEKLFVYGTLVNPHIQQEVLGRTIKGKPDTLSGYKKSKVIIQGQIYPILTSSSSKSEIKGLVLQISEDELKKLDEYETSVYRRIKVELKSKAEAWVYIQ